jgi:two-component system chemotaxis response regulator CheB
MDMESRIAEFQLDAMHDEHRPGKPSGFGCPDCGGALWELDEGELVRYRCRVGHAWTANSLVAEQSEGVETALWTALRALEERAALCHRIADRLRSRNNDSSAARFDDQAGEARRRAEVLRQVLVTEPVVSAELPSTAAPPFDPGPRGGGNGRDDG